MCDVARVPSKWALGVQREGDGDRYVDGTRIVQEERNLSTGARLDTGHAHVLRRGGLIPAVLYRFVLRHAEVQLVEAQQKSVPVLQEGMRRSRAEKGRLTTKHAHTFYIYSHQTVVIRGRAGINRSDEQDVLGQTTEWPLTSVSSGDLISLILKK